MRLVVFALFGGLCVPVTATADPPNVIHKVELHPDGPGLATCLGMSFLPDGARVVVRWERLPKLGERAEAGMTMFGRPTEPMETLPAPVPRSGRWVQGGNQIAVAKSADVVTVDDFKHLLVWATKAKVDEQKTRRLEWSPAGSISGARLWFAGPDEVLFAAAQEFDTAYQLSTVRSPLNNHRARPKPLLSGGDRNTWLRSADLHPSGRWFAASFTQLGGEKAMLDVWQIGESPQKKSVRLPSAAASTVIAPDAKTVATGLEDGRVAFYRTPDLAIPYDPMTVGQFTVGALSYHPRGRYLACGTFDSMGNENLLVIDPLTREIPIRFAADPAGVVAVCFNANGSRMATFGGSGRVTIWDTSGLHPN